MPPLYTVAALETRSLMVLKSIARSQAGHNSGLLLARIRELPACAPPLSFRWNSTRADDLAWTKPTSKAEKKAHWKRNSKVRSRMTRQDRPSHSIDQRISPPTVYKLCRFTHRLCHWRKRRRRLCFLFPRKVHRIRSTFWRWRRSRWQGVYTSSPADAQLGKYALSRIWR